MNKLKQIFMKVNAILLMCVFLLSLVSPIISNAQETTTTITFKDEKIYELIAKQLKNKITSKDDSTYTITMTQSNLESVNEISLINNIPVAISATTKEAISIKVEKYNIEGIEKFINLTKLEIDKYDINSINPLKQLTKLTDLKINNSEIDDISALNELINLKQLELKNNKITDINALKSLKNLQILNLSGNQISDINILSNLTNLTELNLNRNQISNISSLGNLTKLKKLALGQLFPIDKDTKGSTIKNNIKDISVLKNLTELTELYLGANEITDISALQGLTNLTKLDLGMNQIVDITPLENMTNLVGLNLMYNKINDIKALNKLVKIGSKSNYNKELDSSQKTLELMLTLLNLDCLLLNNNQIADLSPISPEVLKYTLIGAQNVSMETNKKEVQLPPIFIQANDTNSDLYSSEEMELVNCTLSSDFTKAIIEDTTKEATVTIKGGPLEDSKLTIISKINTENQEGSQGGTTGQQDPPKENTSEGDKQDPPNGNTSGGDKQDPPKENTPEGDKQDPPKGNTSEGDKQEPSKGNDTNSGKNETQKQNTTTDKGETFQNNSSKTNANTNKTTMVDSKNINNTISPLKLPQTGKNTLAIGIICVILISIGLWIKNRSYRDIK